jgi:hypothetical protein
LPVTYYEVVDKRTDVGRLSARDRNDIAMKVEIRRMFNENFQRPTYRWLAGQ